MRPKNSIPPQTDKVRSRRCASSISRKILSQKGKFECGCFQVRDRYESWAVYPDVGGGVFRPFGGGRIKRIRSHSKKGPGFWWNGFSRTSRRGRVDGRWTGGDHLQSRSEQPGTFSAGRKVA